MRHEDFNEKYKQFLKPGYNGLEVTLSYEGMKILDEKFQEFIKQPDFKYSKIEYSFGKGRFLADEISIDEMYEVEKILTKDNPVK